MMQCSIDSRDISYMTSLTRGHTVTRLHKLSRSHHEDGSHTHILQSELPRPIPLNSVESDNGYTSRIYFDNAGGNVTQTLYNVTLTSQKPC